MATENIIFNNFIKLKRLIPKLPETFYEIQAELCNLFHRGLGSGLFNCGMRIADYGIQLTEKIKRGIKA